MRAFRLLLRLYPASFRTEYGEEICAVFARNRRDARSALGMTALWLGAVGDTCVNAAKVHWDILQQDVRYAARTLRRSPGFAVTVIAIVSLGIGATTAAFSVMDFVLIRPLPFPDAQRLVNVWGAIRGSRAWSSRRPITATGRAPPNRSRRLPRIAASPST